MSLILITTIRGVSVAEYARDFINIYFDDVTYVVSALNTSGGTTKITYENFTPDYAEGHIIGGIGTPTDEVNIYFTKYYPFGYVVVSPPSVPIPGILIDSVITTRLTAIGANDGTATVNASGGTSPYEYSIDGVNFQSSNFFSGLAAGQYAATVRSASNPSQNSVGYFTVLAAIPPPDPPAPAPVKEAIANIDAEIEIQNAYKRVRVLSVFGNAPSIVSNGDFETYDGQNWDFWVKYGGINVTRFQRSVLNSNGAATPLQNYAIQFNEKAIDNKFIRHSDIAVQVGDTMKVSYRVGQTPNTGSTRGVYYFNGFTIPSTYSTFYLSKIRIRNGGKYLYNPDYGNTYQWVSQVATVSHRIDNPQGDLSNFNISFNIPEMPSTGALTIELYGFTQVDTILTDEYKFYTATIPPHFVSNESASYSPIVLDDFSALKSSQSGDNENDGILSISDNLRSFSESPDKAEILFGDYFYRQGKTDALDNLYSIKYNGQYTDGWLEFTGGSSRPVAFGLGLAKSILTAYQKPFRKWSGNLTLIPGKRSFAYLDIFSFIVKNAPAFNRKQFALVGCEIDLKSNQLENAIMMEIFDRAAKSSDISVPSYPDMPDPVFVQDPNATTNNGIFTEEFTQEFI